MLLQIRVTATFDISLVQTWKKTSVGGFRFCFITRVLTGTIFPLFCLGPVSLRLDFTGVKLAVTPSLFASIKYVTCEFSETFSLFPGVYFPLPILYAL